MDSRNSLPELLDRHSKSLPPDYWGFYNSVRAILASGVPPRKLCESFAAELQGYDAQMRRYSERGEKGEKLSQSELDAFRGVFHKHKLLTGCVEKLPPDMRQLIFKLAAR